MEAGVLPTRNGGQKGLHVSWSPTGPCSISAVFILGTHRLGLLGSSSQTPITSILCWFWRVHLASFSVSVHLSIFTRLSSFQAQSMNLNPATSSPLTPDPRRVLSSSLRLEVDFAQEGFLEEFIFVVCNLS